MRHRKGYAKLGMPTQHRFAVIRNMVTSLIEHERIITTLPRAKEVRKFAEKIITLGKDGSLNARRRVYSFLLKDEAVKKVFGELSQRYKDRNGGYTRIVRVGWRRGDGAEKAILELVDRKEKVKAEKAEVTTEKVEKEEKKEKKEEKRRWFSFFRKKG